MKYTSQNIFPKILTAVIACIVLSCSSGSPEGTVKEFLKHVDNFEYDKAETSITTRYHESLDNIKRGSAAWSESKKEAYKKTPKPYQVLLKEQTDSTASVFVSADTDGGMPMRTMFFLKKRNGQWLIDQTEE